MVLGLTENEVVAIHKEILYPVVRVRTDKAGGSGLIIYSKPTPESKEDSPVFESYVITCEHVIDDAVKFVKKWSSIAQREVMVEDRQLVQVEVFKYEKLSRCIGGTTYQAEIIAWDKQLDIAVLKMKTEEKMPYVAKIYPKGKSDEIKLGTSVIACGCSMGHEPLFTFGNIVSKHDMIENKEYWMSTANTIFGNSGGPMFTARGHEFIGNTARITALQLGFGVDIVTWMGFFIPIDSIYSFFDDNFLMFIYDPKYTSTQCAEMRKKKMEEEERKLLLPQKGEPRVTVKVGVDEGKQPE